YGRRIGGPPETAAFLAGQPSLPPLAPSAPLAAAAARQASDQAQAAQPGHVGRDGSTVRSRAQDAGLFASIVAEEIALGQSDARAVVRQLIVDEGYPAHPHRADLFSPNLKSAGAACGPHVRFRTLCVIDLAGAPAPR
ncbi:MAG TPA: CAP domain-containing protein, partial [Caulobacteraceae bacterium]|nr:CAP domain-containing protein [Caulobacteraceae bacterium]